MQAAFEIAGEKIAPGTRNTVSIPVSLLSEHTPMNLTVEVIHGKRPGPVMFVSAAIHGDEIIGVEIIRRLASLKALGRVRGTLILIPVVNSFGFISHSRYLPDRRDLNRSFPGSKTGSLAAQLAAIFMNEIVSRSDFGIDLHSGAIHRANLPQIRADLSSETVSEMAEAFGASVLLNANLRDGSLRQAAQEVGCDILLYEASEALRFDETAIRIGVKGIMNVMRHVGILAPARKKPQTRSVKSMSSHWLRASIGGVMRAHRGLGDRIRAGEGIAVISDPLGKTEERIIARTSGIIIGRTNLPVVNRGDALFHVAQVKDLSGAEETLEALENEVDADPLFDGAEII